MQANITKSMVEPGSIRSLSRPTSAWVTTTATVAKSLQIAKRYVPDLVGNFVELALRIVFFLLIANAVTFRGSGMGGSARETFIFFQGALLLLVFNGPTLWEPIRAVTNDLYNGTLEYLYSSPGSRYAYYVGTVVTEVLISLVAFFPFYIFLIVYSNAAWGVCS